MKLAMPDQVRLCTALASIAVHMLAMIHVTPDTNEANQVKCMIVLIVYSHLSFSPLVWPSPQ